MLRKLRERMESEKGFTLIELLVVILIIGILAAIALPAFLGQRAKGQDADAKATARSAATAQETYYTDEDTYTSLKADLEKIEPSLTGGNYTTTGTATGYTVVATSKSTGTFTITNTGGTMARTCSKPGDGACPKSGKW